MAENRPSLIKGDQVLVRFKDSKGELEKDEYQGFVHVVGLSDVHLRFCPRCVTVVSLLLDYVQVHLLFYTTFKPRKREFFLRKVLKFGAQLMGTCIRMSLVEIPAQEGTLDFK